MNDQRRTRVDGSAGYADSGWKKMKKRISVLVMELNDFLEHRELRFRRRSKYTEAGHFRGDSS
jgi:hypothetical protein